jgi:hypothetical protein
MKRALALPFSICILAASVGSASAAECKSGERRILVGTAPECLRMTHTPAGEYQGMGAGPRRPKLPSNISLDRAGVPMVLYDQWAYNPVTVAQYGLSRYSLFARYRDHARLKEARRAAEWLVSSQQPDGSWLYFFHWNVEGVEYLDPLGARLSHRVRG